MSAGLSDEATLALAFLGDRFPVGNLGFADIAFDVELSPHSVHDDVQMEFAHAGNDGLTGFRIGIGLEGRIFLAQLGQREVHLVLVISGLRFHRHVDDRIGEDHGFQMQFVSFIAECITGSGILEANGGGDVSGMDFGDVLLVIGMHLQNASEPLLLPSGGIVDVRTALGCSRVDPEIGQLAHVGVGHDLEDQRRKRRIVISPDFHILTVLVGALHRADIKR